MQVFDVAFMIQHFLVPCPSLAYRHVQHDSDRRWWKKPGKLVRIDNACLWPVLLHLYCLVTWSFCLLACQWSVVSSPPRHHPSSGYWLQHELLVLPSRHDMIYLITPCFRNKTGMACSVSTFAQSGKRIGPMPTPCLVSKSKQNHL